MHSPRMARRKTRNKSRKKKNKPRDADPPYHRCRLRRRCRRRRVRAGNRRRHPDGGGTLHQPGLLLLPCSRQAVGHLRRSRRRARPLLQRRLLGLSRLEGTRSPATTTASASATTPRRAATATSTRRRRSSTDATTSLAASRTTSKRRSPQIVAVSRCRSTSRSPAMRSRCTSAPRRATCPMQRCGW